MISSFFTIPNVLTTTECQQIINYCSDKCKPSTLGEMSIEVDSVEDIRNSVNTFIPSFLIGAFFSFIIKQNFNINSLIIKIYNYVFRYKKSSILYSGRITIGNCLSNDNLTDNFIAISYWIVKNLESNQFINDKLKLTENPRLISP